MLSEQPNRACLGSFVAHFFGERNVRPHRQVVECAVEHAVAVKIDLVAIGSFQKTELAGSIEVLDGPDRLTLVMLHLALHSTHMVLQLSSRVLEGIIDGELQIGMALVRRRRTRDIDFATVRKRQMNVHLIETAGAVVPTRRLQHDPAGCYSTATFFQRSDMPLDRSPDIRSRPHALKIDFNRCLHGSSPSMLLDISE